MKENFQDKLDFRKMLLAIMLIPCSFIVLMQVYGFIHFKFIYLKPLLKIVFNHIFVLHEESLLVMVKHIWLLFSFFQIDAVILPASLMVLTSVGISYMFYSSKGKSLKGGPNTEKITRGPRLLNAKEINEEFLKTAKQETLEIYNDLPKISKKRFNKKDFLNKLIGKPFSCSSTEEEVKIPEYILSRHMAFLGTTGTGKTTQIKHLLEHINNLGEKALILDLNGELYSEIGRQDDIILSPFDSRSHKWDFSHELSKGMPINSMEYGKYIIPQGSEANSFWWTGSRTVFSELLDIYKDAKCLWAAVTDPERKFRHQLSGVVQNIIGKPGSTQDAGILGTLSSDLGFLRHLNNMNETCKKDYFSIASWAQNPGDKNVFLIISDKDMESISPLLRIWINIAVLGRFDAGADNKLNKMNMIVDEVGSLRRLEQLPNALARLRKYSGKVVLGLQSEGQLNAIYGSQEAKAMKSNIGTRFIFRTPEESEAKSLSSFLGRSEVVSVSQNTSFDKSGNPYNSQNESTSYKDIVLASEIMELADGHFYLKSLNISPAKLRIHKKKWPRINDGQIFLKSSSEEKATHKKFSNNKEDYGDMDEMWG